MTIIIALATGFICFVLGTLTADKIKIKQENKFIKNLSDNIWLQNRKLALDEEGNRLFRAEMIALHFRLEKLLGGK